MNNSDWGYPTNDDYWWQGLIDWTRKNESYLKWLVAETDKQFYADNNP